MSDFVLAISADPDEMPYVRHFIWVYTVCQSMSLGLSGLQRVESVPSFEK